MKNNSAKSRLLTAAMSGLLTVGVPAFAAAQSSTNNTTNVTNNTANSGVRLAPVNQQGDKHSCKGKNDCKGQGGCKSGDNGCKGKNSCKGKGGCATDGSNPHRA